MQREDERQPLAQIAQHLEQRAERGGVVDVGRPVQRDDAVAAADVERRTGRPCRARAFARSDGLRAIGEQRIDHDVADEVGALGGNAFARQVVVRRALGRVQEIGDLVGQHAVDLFGHRAVVAAQPASTCATGTPFFDATSEHASVELTSPTTTTHDGRCGRAPARSGASLRPSARHASPTRLRD
jgi:hypothetical protein